MLRRMSGILCVLLVVGSYAFSQAKPGGVARELAMGGSKIGTTVISNPYLFDDPSLMLVNPAFQARYRDYLWMNVAGGAVTGFNNNVYGNQNAGVNFAFNKDFTVGAILSYDPSLTNSLVNQLSGFVTATQAGRAQTGLAPIDVFSVLGAYHMGALDLGFGVTYGWAKNSASNVGNPVAPASNDAELSASMIGFNAGMILDFGAGSAFDASASVRFDKATDNITGTNGAGAAQNSGEYSASATEIQLQARLRLRMSNRVNFVPFAAFGTGSGEPKQDAPPAGLNPTLLAAKNTLTALAVGVGTEYHVPGFYLAGGVSFQSTSLKNEDTRPVGGTTTTATTTTTTSSTGIPVFNLGAEFDLTSWLAGRVGYYRAFNSNKNKVEPPSPASTSETNAFAGSSLVAIANYAGADNSLITLGTGLKFGGFALDAVISEDALRRGLGIIGGGTDNINTFGYVTASYCFQ